MPVSPTTRSGKGAPLLPSEGDLNWTTIAAAINALEAKLGVVLNPDGTLKAGAVGTVDVVVDGLLTVAKFKALEEALRSSVVTIAADGSWSVLKGTVGQLLRFGVDGVPTAVDVATAVPVTTGEWLQSGDLPVLLNESSETAAWQELDLSPWKTTLGATGATAVILRAECAMESATGFATPNRVLLRVCDVNTGSTTSDNTHRCIAQTRGAGFNDQAVSAAQNCEMTVKLAANGKIYWNTAFTDAPAGSYAKLWLVGFRKL